MISRSTIQVFGVLLVLTGAGVTTARAEDAPGNEVAAEPDDAETPAAKLDLPEPDWSQLSTSLATPDRFTPPKRAAAKPTDPSTAWSNQDKANGASALTVKTPISSFWNARIGADMTIVNQQPTAADLLRQKYSTDGQPSQSSGAAWAAVTAPGVGSIWDKTAVEARVDPSQDQSKLGTSISKSLPLGGDQYSLTLQNGYNVIEQGTAPVPGLAGRSTRSYQTDQSAKLSITDTGTSFRAGQSLSSTDDKWLRSIGAEQKLFGGVSVTGSISETPQGTPNRSFGAAFKHSW